MLEASQVVVPDRVEREDDERRGEAANGAQALRPGESRRESDPPDLSACGAFVITGSLRELGSPVELTFPAARGEVRARGLARWVRQASDSERPSRAAGTGVEVVVPPHPADEAP